MLTSITDVDREILYKLSDGDILKACSVNKAAAEKICNDLFFHNLLLKRYPKALSFLEKEEKDKEYKYKQIYLKILYYKDIIRDITEKTFKIPFIFTDGDIKKYYDLFTKRRLVDLSLLSSSYGFKDLLKYSLNNMDKNTIYYGGLLKNMIKNNFFTLAEIKQIIGNEHIPQFYLSESLEFAVINKNKDIENYLIEKGADINYALYGAAELNDVSLIKEYINKGANKIESARFHILHDPKIEEDFFNTFKFFEHLFIYDDDPRMIRKVVADKGYLNVFKYLEKYKYTDSEIKDYIARTLLNKRWEMADYLIKNKLNDPSFLLELSKGPHYSSPYYYTITITPEIKNFLSKYTL